MKDGRVFETEVAEFYRLAVSNNPNSVVTQNRRISGPDGDREFDVVIQTQVADITLTTVIECKDYGRLVNVTTVDAFASKLDDIRAAKGVLVSRKGFTQSALDKAKRLNISACTLDRASVIAKDSELNLPVLFRKVAFGPMSLGFELATAGSAKSVRFDANSLVCDTGIMQIVSALDPEIILREKLVVVDLSKLWPGRELWIRDTEGNRVPLASSTLRFEINSPVFFGYLSDLPSSMYKRDEISSDTTLTFNFADFHGIDSALKSYRSYSDVPEYAKRLYLTAVVVPERVESIGGAKLYAHRK